MGGFLSLASLLPDSAFAASGSGGVLLGAFDAASVPSAGRPRARSFLQAAAVLPATGAAAVSGDFPAPGPELLSKGAVPGLVRDPAGLPDRALSDSAVSGSAPDRYPGCGAPDVVLANGQVWAACNAGATEAFSGTNVAPACDSAGPGCPADPYPSERRFLGDYFQWGRNEPVTSLGSGAVLAATGSSSSSVLGSSVANPNAPYDWIAAQDGNLWGGGSTSLGAGTFAGQSASDRALMKGPCAAGYHVPTQAEWWAAVSAISPGLANSASWQDDASVAATLKLPLAGSRTNILGVFVYQGSYGGYWTSSPSGTNAHSIHFQASKALPAAAGLWRTNGLSVRCLKD